MKYLSFDTNFIIQYRYNFDNDFFKRILNYVNKGIVKIILSSVVDYEIKKHLTDHLSKAVNDYNKCCEDLSFLQDTININKMNSDSLIKDALIKYENFKKEYSIEIIGFNYSKTENIFKEYFSNCGVFKEGKKKNEFPDAFAVDSILNYVKDDEIMILSYDMDWHKKLFECGFELVEDDHVCSKKNKIFKKYQYILSYLADFVVNSSDDASNYFKEHLDAYENLVKDAINSTISELQYPRDDAEITDYGVEDLSFDSCETVIIDDKKMGAIISLKITYYIISSYDDYDNGAWDSEDKEYIFLPHYITKYVIEDTVNIFVIFNYSYDINGNLLVSNETYDDVKYHLTEFYNVIDTDVLHDGYED